MVLAYFDIETKNDWFCLIWLTPWQLKSPPVKGGMEKAATSNCCPWPENSECVVFAMANWLNPCRQNIYQSRSFHFIHSPSSSPLFTSSKFSASLSSFIFSKRVLKELNDYVFFQVTNFHLSVPVIVHHVPASFHLQAPLLPFSLKYQLFMWVENLLSMQSVLICH